MRIFAIDSSTERRREGSLFSHSVVNFDGLIFFSGRVGVVRGKPWDTDDSALFVPIGVPIRVSVLNSHGLSITGVSVCRDERWLGRERGRRRGLRRGNGRSIRSCCERGRCGYTYTEDIAPPNRVGEVYASRNGRYRCFGIRHSDRDVRRSCLPPPPRALALRRWACSRHKRGSILLISWEGALDLTAGCGGIGSLV